MDESTVENRLDRIERLQYLVVGLLSVSFLVRIATLIGPWVAGTLSAALGVVAFAAIAARRRRGRDRGRDTDER